MDGKRYCQKRGWLWAVPVLGWKWGVKVLRGRMCNVWMQENTPWALPGSAQQPGVAQQCLNPSQCQIPWESPGLAAPGMVGHRWVGGQAVGSKRTTLLEKVCVSIRERKAGSRMSDSWGKKSSWIGEEQRKCCSSAPPITGRGRIKVSFGRCFSRTWP